MTVQFLDAWGFSLMVSCSTRVQQLRHGGHVELWHYHPVPAGVVTSRGHTGADLQSVWPDPGDGLLWDAERSIRLQQRLNTTLLYNVISLCTTLLNCFKWLFSPKLQFYLCLFTINVSYATCVYTTTVEKFGLFCLKWINIVTRWGCIILINGKDVCSLSKYFWHKYIFCFFALSNLSNPLYWPTGKRIRIS